MVVTLLFWVAHCRALPYAYTFQNALESLLYGETVLLLLLAGVYTALPSEPPAARIALEVVMLLLAFLIGPWVEFFYPQVPFQHQGPAEAVQCQDREARPVPRLQLSKARGEEAQARVTFDQ